MSYLTRLSARTAGPGANTSAVMPKGLNRHQSAVIARMEETEKETLSAVRTPPTGPLRRQETEGEEPEAQRQPGEEGEEELAALRRQPAEEEEQLAPLRRLESGEDEEQLATLRRQNTEEAEEEEQLAPLRRQVEEEEEEALQPMRTIARQEEVPLEDTGQTAPPPAQANLEPGAEPVSQEFAGEPEPSDLQALHRDMSSALTQSQQQQSAAQLDKPEHRALASPSGEVFAPPSLTVPDLPDRNAFNHMPPQTTGSNDSLPNVIIEQLDVLIQEPAFPAGPGTPRRNRDRSLRARYLRRL